MAEVQRMDEVEQELLLNDLKHARMDEFRERFFDRHSYDQGKWFASIEPEEREILYRFLSPEEMAAIFENLDTDEKEIEMYLSEMDSIYAAQMLAQMYADDAVDVLNELDQSQVAGYLTLMEEDAAKEIRELLHYKEFTAGSIMTTEFVAIHAQQTVRSAMQILKTEAPNAETIYYTFVVDEDKRLVGVVSLRDLIISEDDTMISEIMNERVYSVLVSVDQEEAARKIRDYNFLALPVVDIHDRLLGIITIDDIVDVIDEEASEDYSKLAGISDADSQDKGPFSAAKKRLPWLIILLFLGMLTASLIGRFEKTLDQVAILSVFIPLIAGMAGNTGTQALAVAIRRIALGETAKETAFKILMREAGTGLIAGTVCGVAVTGVVFVWKGDLVLGLLVGAAILFSLIVAAVAGAMVPLIMHRFKIDPAVASGPFITTINDIISILIYLGLATLFIQNLH
ncbi:magnesium transporter [Bacillus mangrovi]|uniref:Magnesium transporter MgtE n=1 Tax=Metabacillus mangrovi TaxID=1491830 RepID=A0A7X2V4B4_9BACI|nr:magnesium transporter [Metabacillus mangrovi]MTH53220.1 magnesium transporter [Metabacillus mangrovi]